MHTYKLVYSNSILGGFQNSWAGSNILQTKPHTRPIEKTNIKILFYDRKIFVFQPSTTIIKHPETVVECNNNVL